jgi:hypothetical protein
MSTAILFAARSNVDINKHDARKNKKILRIFSPAKI